MDGNIVLVLYAVGGVLATVGTGWLWWLAFRAGVWWGLAGFIPGGLQMFALTHFRRAWPPLAVAAVGFGLLLYPAVYNHLVKDTGQTTAQVFGDSITVTGAKTGEFEKVKAHKGWKTVQAANAGLTDDDAAAFDGMDRLAFLDVSDNPLTDAALERLVKLPALAKLYVARTKITPDAVKRLVLDDPNSTISEIDVTGLDVPGKAIREWKAAKPGRLANQ